jgi:hypothetical protein
MDRRMYWLILGTTGYYSSCPIVMPAGGFICCRSGRKKPLKKARDLRSFRFVGGRAARSGGVGGGSWSYRYRH